MGGSGSKRRFFWQKKRSPVERAWRSVKKLHKQNKKKKKNKQSQRKPSVPGLDKSKGSTTPPWHHRLSLGALGQSTSTGTKGDSRPREKRSLSLPPQLRPKL